METPIYFKQLEEDDESKFKLVCWPRRSGKTTYIANQIANSFMRRENLLVVAPNRSILEGLIYNSNNILGQSPLVYNLVKNITVNTIGTKFSTVFYNTCFSSEPIRGQNFDKILIEEGEMLTDKQWRNLFPNIENTPTEIFFTPIIYKKNNVPLVKDLWDNCTNKWETYRIDYKFMPNWKEIRKMKDTISKEDWKTQFLCEWVEIE